MNLIKLFFSVANEALKKFPDYDQKIEKDFYDLYEQLVFHRNKAHHKRNDDYIDHLYDKLRILGEKLQSQVREKDV